MNLDEPERIDHLSELEGKIKYTLGRGIFVHSTDYLQDGRIAAYLGVVTPVDTSPWPSDREISFLNYAPVGAAFAVPDGDGYELDLPSRDDLNEAYLRRRDREDPHREEIISSTIDFLEYHEELQRKHAVENGLLDIGPEATVADLAPTVFEAFQLGRNIGGYQLASRAKRVVERRLVPPPEDEQERYAAAVPAVRNYLKDRRSRHYDAASEFRGYPLEEGGSISDLPLDPMEAFRLGLHVGRQNVASAAHRHLEGKISDPYDGGRRWASPGYEVIRKRRTRDLPAPLEGSEA